MDELGAITMSTTGPVLKLLRLPVRGGYWAYAGNAGLAALNLSNARTYASSHFGFRPASDYPEGPEGRRLRLPVQSSVERMPVPRRKAKNTHAAGAQYRKGALSAVYKDATVAKTYNGLMAQIATFDALHAAYMKARRGKRRVRKLQRDYAAGAANFADIHQQLNSMIAHARHGDAMSAIEKTLQTAIFRRAA